MFILFQCMNFNVDYNVEVLYVVLFMIEEFIFWELY